VAERARSGWLVAVAAFVGVLATGGLTAWAGSPTGSYVGKVQVVVHPPRNPTINPIASSDTSAVMFASLITQQATRGEVVPRVTNQNLTLADQGMHQDTLISLVNLGGQWANDFSRPFISVEAVDSTAAAVLQRLHEGVAEVTAAMDHLQNGAGVAPAERATLETVPAVFAVQYEGTHRSRAMAMSVVVGLAATAMVCGRLRPSRRTTDTRQE